MPGISRVMDGTKAKNQRIFKSLKCGLRYLCAIALFQQLVEICQMATTLIITVSSWHYTLASFRRYKAKIKILFFCEPSLWVEVSNDVLVPGFHCAYRASRGCNHQIFIRRDCHHQIGLKKKHYVLLPGFHLAHRASRGCNQQIFIRGDMSIS